MTEIRIRWNRAVDGFVESKCGRFRVIPEYWGRANPQMYRVEDTMPGGFGIGHFETQKKCKEWVERGFNPPTYDGPEITEDML